MIRIAVAAVVLLALAGGAAYWTLARDDGAEAGVQVVRWGKITVTVSEASGVVAVPEFAPPEIKPPDGGQVLLLVKGESRLAIDADTGEVIQDTVEAAERDAIDEVLATIEVKEFDEKTGPWPYGSTLPNTPKERWGNITFTLPNAESGLTVYQGVSDSAQGGFPFLQVTNGRSTLSINAQTGAVARQTTKITVEDAEAFDRFLSAVEYGGPSP